MKISTLKTDEKREHEGVWVDAGAGLRLLIARDTNPKYVAFLRKAGRPLRSVFRSGGGDDAADAITKQAAAKHLLLGWENLEDDVGQPIPYSSEKALELFKTVPDFFRLVVEFAADASLYRAQELEDSIKN